MLNIGWFSTGRGEGSRGLLRFIQRQIEGNSLEANLQFVFSNREPGEAEGSDQFFRLVDSCRIPLVTLSSAAFRRERRSAGSPPAPWAQLRSDFDRRTLEALSEYQPDICVLAGYMLIVGPEVCRRYPLLNLHPALPDGPIGTWQEVIWKLIESGAERTGAMIHLATEAVDRGPALSYCAVPIVGPDFDPAWQALAGQDLATAREREGEGLALFQQIRQAEYRCEPYLLLETLRAVAEGRLALREGEIWDANGQPLAATFPYGLCMDAEIERRMRAEGCPAW